MAFTSFTKPAEISLRATFCAVAPLSVGGATRKRSLRWAAAPSRTSCVSVSLMDMDAPSRLRLGPSQSRPLTDASPGSTRSPGLRVCPAAPSRRRNIHTHAPFRTERQSFLRCRDARLTVSRKQRSGHAAAPPDGRGHRSCRARHCVQLLSSRGALRRCGLVRTLYALPVRYPFRPRPFGSLGFERRPDARRIVSRPLTALNRT